MSQRNVLLNCFSGLRMGLAAVVAAQLALGGAFASSAQAEEREAERTRTPIKHVIVLIGENRTFDHVFATYKPRKGNSLTTCCPRESSRKTELLAPTSRGRSSFRLSRRSRRNSSSA